MTFEKMPQNILETRKGSPMMAAGTTIETKVGPFWKNDGYDDKVPLAQYA